MTGKVAAVTEVATTDAKAIKASVRNVLKTIRMLSPFC